MSQEKTNRETVPNANGVFEKYKWGCIGYKQETVVYFQGGTEFEAKYA